MRVLLKAGSKIWLTNENDTSTAIACILSEKDVEFKFSELQTDALYRIYKFKRPYPTYFGREVTCIDWMMENEIIL